MSEHNIKLPNYLEKKDYDNDGFKNIYYTKNEYALLPRDNIKQLNNWKYFIKSHGFFLVENNIYKKRDDVYKYNNLLIKFSNIYTNSKKDGHWKIENLQKPQVKIRIGGQNKKKYKDIDLFVGYYDYDNDKIGFALFDNNILNQNTEDIDCIFKLSKLVEVIQQNKKEILETNNTRSLGKIKFYGCTEKQLSSVIEEMRQGKYLNYFYNNNDYYLYDNEPIWYWDKSKKIRKRNTNISDELKEYINKYYEGKCEFCNNKTFKNDKDQFYLEAHHIIFLSNGGQDNIKNLIALCPNCHRKSHYSPDNEIKLLQNQFENIVKIREIKK